MAQFAGSGSLILEGDDARIYDCEMVNTGGVTNGSLRVNAANGRVLNCLILSAGQRNLDIGSSAVGAVVEGCTVLAIGGGVNWGIAINANDVAIIDTTVRITNTGSSGAILIGAVNHCRVEGCHIEAVTNNEAGIWCDSTFASIVGNTVDVVGSTGGVLVSGPHSTITGNVIHGSSSTAPGLRVHGIGARYATVTANTIAQMQQGIALESFFGAEPEESTARANVIAECGQDGIVIAGTQHNVGGNQIIDCGLAAANTHDGIAITGGTNKVDDNMVRGTSLRYGINVAAGDCNIVVGNDLGDPANYGTDALNDAGTNTQLTYPDDATYGDNFTACGSPTSP